MPTGYLTSGISDTGAVTWGNGATGASGVISTTNSLYGTTTGDRIGTTRIRLEGNGNYLVVSPFWDNGGTADVGAVTWGNGATGLTGPVSTANSLYGATAGDQVGSGDNLALLNNGNYIVISPKWDNGVTTDAGAVTWGNGSTGLTGPVSTANSLYGATAGDQVGSGALAERTSRLSNGNYVIASPNWDNGGTVNVGAVTWGSGASGITGPVTSANSLIGATANDQVGARQPTKGTAIRALSDGNYTVLSYRWNGVRGAITWGDGAAGTTGIVSVANSLVGTNPGDLVAPDRSILPNGQYLIKENSWNGNRGAVAWSARTPGLTGVLAEPDSVFGSAANGGNSIVASENTYSDLLNIVAVGRPADNIVTIMFPAWPISVTVTGTGSGVVKSPVVASTLPGPTNSQFWPDQIDCGITCTAHVRVNNVITLTATADAGSVFTGWSGGGCSGTGDCVVAADAAKEVTATFAGFDIGDAPRHLRRRHP